MIKNHAAIFDVASMTGTEAGAITPGPGALEGFLNMIHQNSERLNNIECDVAFVANKIFGGDPEPAGHDESPAVKPACELDELHYAIRSQAEIIEKLSRAIVRLKAL